MTNFDCPETQEILYDIDRELGEAQADLDNITRRFNRVRRDARTLMNGGSLPLRRWTAAVPAGTNQLIVTGRTEGEAKRNLVKNYWHKDISADAFTFTNEDY